jgi:hypothetical protein
MAAVFEEGDEVTVVIKGKITDSKKAGTADALTIRATRPGRSYGSAPAIKVDLVLDTDAKVTYEVVSVHKNGVHIDAEGNYWMRKPGGWHKMTVAAEPARTSFGGQPVLPRQVQRLVEPKDKKAK